MDGACFAMNSVAGEGSFRGGKEMKIDVGVRIWQKQLMVFCFF